MNSGSRGSTLIVVLLLSSVLAVAGLSLSIVAQQERALSVHYARELRLRRAALDAVRLTAAWFTEPGSGPTPDQVERRRQPVNPLDPHGPPLPPVGEYKEGIDLDQDGADDLFRPPHGGSNVHRFLGHSDHPDVTIRDESFLLRMTRHLFGENEPTAAERRRIERVELFAPPTRRVGGEWVHDGTASIRAVVVLERSDGEGGYRGVGRREARGVLREIPYSTLAGPMVESCASLYSQGVWSPRWGVVRIGGDLHIEDLPGAIPASLPVDVDGELWSSDQEWIAAFNAAVDPGKPIPDPWLRIAASGAVTGAPVPDAQPWPHAPPPIGSPAPWNCCGHSHVRQLAEQSTCPPLDYRLWKSLAQSRLRDTAYFEWVEADRYREPGGVVRSMQQILADRAGEAMLRFFDTADGRPPVDLDGDGAFENLAPAVTLFGRIGLRGLTIVHANGLTLRDLDDWMPVSLSAPREPASPDGSAWVDLRQLPDGRFYPGGPPERSEIEPVATVAAAIEGALIQAGDLKRLGRGTVVGRIRAREIILNAEAADPSIFPIPELGERGVVAAWRIPVFVITEIGIDGG